MVGAHRVGGEKGLTVFDAQVAHRTHAPALDFNVPRLEAQHQWFQTAMACHRLSVVRCWRPIGVKMWPGSDDQRLSGHCVNNARVYVPLSLVSQEMVLAAHSCTRAREDNRFSTRLCTSSSGSVKLAVNNAATLLEGVRLHADHAFGCLTIATEATTKIGLIKFMPNK